jgi:hypothetical protein
MVVFVARCTRSVTLRLPRLCLVSATLRLTALGNESWRSGLSFVTKST